MGILRNVWEEERNDVIYGKIVGWESHSSSGGRRVFDGHRWISGGDGCVFEGDRWIHYYNGWSTVPVGRGVVVNNTMNYDQYHVVGSKTNYPDYHVKQQPQQIPVRVSLLTRGQGREDHNYHVRENNTMNYDHRHFVGHHNNNYNVNNDHYEARVGANNYTVLQPPPQNVRPQVVMVKSSPTGQQWQQKSQQPQQQQGKSSLSGQQRQQQQQRQELHHGKGKEQEDVDAKAEEYIRKKKQKFAQASIMEY